MAAKTLAQARDLIRWRSIVLVAVLLLVGRAPATPDRPLFDQGGAEDADRSGECQTGPSCSNFNTNHPTGTFSTTSANWMTVDTCIYAGDYAYYSVTAGQTYEWSLCPADGGNAPYDSQLTLWDQGGTTHYCYSDDWCFDDAIITWTATFSGTVRVLVSQYSCGNNSTCTTLVWRCATCSTADKALIFDAWWTNEVNAGEDACQRSARLNWDPDVLDCNGTLTVFEKVYWRPAGSGTWTLRTTTSDHIITNCSSSDAWYEDYTFNTDCGPFDWKIEIYRSGESAPDEIQDPSNDLDLAGHQEERPADDVAICPGDLNCDGQIDFGDINPFVTYLSNNAAWQAEFPSCTPLNGDIDGDGTYGQGSLGDINPFVALFASGAPPFPCP